MYPIKKIILIVLLFSFNSFVFANEKPFTGVFSGDGRACYGKLFIKTKTLEWHASFTKCERTPYEIYKNDLHNAKIPEIVYKLKKSKSCAYEIVQVTFAPNTVGFWDVTGYGSVQDYLDQKNDYVGCLMEKMD